MGKPLNHRALVVVAAAALLAQLSCVGPGIQAQADVVRSDIDKARKSNAYQCAPRELALAETSVDFAENELAQGDWMRARQHMDLAIENANKALANSKECAPKRVLIKTKTDKDGDGILDEVDACPEQPEDKDLFEDEDGCPDPDNDKDTVLDPLDKCPNTAGPVENEGCPYGDRDGDGINDKEDACPDAPEDKDGDRDSDGRPDLDVDGDGVEDCVAGCPMLPTKGPDGKEVAPPSCDLCTAGTPETTKEDKDNFEDADGCPEVDNDKDGLLDNVDACPNEPGPPENKGCPIKDKDGDGFLDDKDACPEVAGVKWPNNPAKDGCPRLDTDGDGYYDDEDACPTKAGVAWPDDPKKNGCPPKLTLVEVTDDEIKIKQQVQFDTGKATIKPVSAKLLAEVGLVIRQSPNIKKVTVEGHTDDVGDDDYNMNLSQDRANSVRQWLIDKEKVEPDRLEAVGFGETRPIMSNRTSQGRQANRRVEFKVERAVKVKQIIEPDAANPK
jgi:outer membrane protein OmpA-like peptidoglycan-associated protein